MKFRITHILALVMAALTSSSIGWCGIVRHDRPVESYREMGSAAEFQSVGEVTRVRKPGDRWRPSASAVLIAPRWVLTAGHVAAAQSPEQRRYHFGGKEYRGIKWVLHPAADFEDRTKGLSVAVEGADLALVQLDRAVNDVPPAMRYRGKDEVGRSMTKVGYGCIGDGMGGMSLVENQPIQERRGGRNVIDAAGGTVQDLMVSETVLLCDFDDPNDSALNQIGDTTPVELEIGQSVGDSGGGWFIEDEGSWKLVAITSTVLPNKGQARNTNVPKYGLIMAGMRVSTANEWIDSVISESSSTD